MAKTKLEKELMSAIHENCIDCCCGEKSEVKKCTLDDSCKLHPYRTGNISQDTSEKHTEGSD